MGVEILYQGNYTQGKEQETYFENLCVLTNQQNVEGG